MPAYARHGRVIFAGMEGTNMKITIKLDGLDSKALYRLTDKNGWKVEWISFELAYRQMCMNEKKMDKWMGGRNEDND